MPTDVQAAVCRTAREPLEIETVKLDDPAPDEVRIGVVGSGLCHSDLHVIDGSFPAPLPVSRSCWCERVMTLQVNMS